MSSEPSATRRKRSTPKLIFGVLLLYGLAAYIILPAMWKRHEKRHPGLDSAQNITQTGAGIPGDPIDVALVGSERDVQRAMLGCGWYPADPITLESSLKIAESVVFRRPYVDAPVSNLYLFGRKEDLAFEKPLGNDATRRHHVRFWKSPTLDDAGRPLWLGAATLDISVGFSHDTGQVTHHVSPDVDAERDLILAELKTGGFEESVYWIDDFHKVLSGKNGEGDPWKTDGRLGVAVLRSGPISTTTRPATAPTN